MFLRSDIMLSNSVSTIIQKDYRKKLLQEPASTKSHTHLILYLLWVYMLYIGINWIGLELYWIFEYVLSIIIESK